MTDTETSAATSHKTYDLTRTKFGVIYTTCAHEIHKQTLPAGIDADALNDTEPVQVLKVGDVTWLRTDYGDSGMGWMVPDPDGDDIDATEIKFCTLLTAEQFAEQLLHGLYLMGAEKTAGALGIPEPDDDGESEYGFYLGWGFMPAFSMDSSDYYCITNAYVTPYPYTADGEPVTELDEEAFDRLVAELQAEYGF